MDNVMTRHHEWVKITITPVETLSDEDGDPVIMVDPTKQANAEDKATYGCAACNVSMVEGYGEECRGFDDLEEGLTA